MFIDIYTRASSRFNNRFFRRVSRWRREEDDVVDRREPIDFALLLSAPRPRVYLHKRIVSRSRCCESAVFPRLSRRSCKSWSTFAHLLALEFFFFFLLRPRSVVCCFLVINRGNKCTSTMYKSYTISTVAVFRANANYAMRKNAIRHVSSIEWWIIIRREMLGCTSRETFWR